MVRGARCPCQPIKPLAGSLSAAGPEQFVTEYAHQPALPSGLVPAQLFGEPRVHAGENISPTATHVLFVELKS